jgi:hypothetical protein
MQLTDGAEQQYLHTTPTLKQNHYCILITVSVPSDLQSKTIRVTALALLLPACIQFSSFLITVPTPHRCIMAEHFSGPGSRYVGERMLHKPAKKLIYIYINSG